MGKLRLSPGRQLPFKIFPGHDGLFQVHGFFFLDAVALQSYGSCKATGYKGLEVLEGIEVPLPQGLDKVLPQVAALHDRLGGFIGPVQAYRKQVGHGFLHHRQEGLFGLCSLIGQEMA